MRVLDNTAAGYEVECGCGSRFRLRTVRQTVECPKCGQLTAGAELVSDFMLNSMDERLVTT